MRFVRDRWTGRLVLKGILHPADVGLARRMGADGVILSSAGGRQLDYAVSPLRVLPSASAEAGDMPLMLDSGVRRGTDVLKTFGLGAKFVFSGSRSTTPRPSAARPVSSTRSTCFVPSCAPVWA